jgi:hypothetical protein
LISVQYKTLQFIDLQGFFLGSFQFPSLFIGLWFTHVSPDFVVSPKFSKHGKHKHQVLPEPTESESNHRNPPHLLQAYCGEAKKGIPAAQNL